MRIGRTLVTMVALGATLTLAYHGAVVSQEQEAAKPANAVGGSYLAYPGTRGTVAFSHLSHAEAGFTCENCHDAIFPKKRGSFKMIDLYKGNACGKCHNGEMKAPKNPELIALPVGMCTSCHAQDKPIKYTPKGADPVEFLHSKHTADAKGVNAGYACGTCHPKPFGRKAGKMKMASPHATMCATCHDGKAVSPAGKTSPDQKTCTTCHKKAG